MSKMSSCLLVFFSALSLSAMATVNISKEKNSEHFEFSVNSLKFSPTVIEGEKFQVVNLVGVDGHTGIKYDVGYPEIPVIRFFALANNESDIHVSVKSIKNSANYKLNGTLKPSLESVEKIIGTTYKIPKILQVRGLFPKTSYEITPAGSINHKKQFLITLYPVQFDSESNSLNISKSFNVDVKKSIQELTQNTKEGIVFVVGKKFKDSPSLSKYRELKKAQGFNIYTIDAPAKITADETRSKIKALYTAQKDLKFAIIVGDADDIPGKLSKVIKGLTDHYFSAIDTDKYEDDINGPDISVGRISVANETELAAVLRKYTRYIKGEFSSRKWLSNISFLATDDRWELAEGTHNYVVDNYTRKLGYTGSFPSTNEIGGDKLYAITYSAKNTDVMANISKGRSIINYSGHGANTYWDAPRVSEEDVRTLTSETSSLPFVISNACITGDYRVPESFAETWQRHEWGAIAFYGSMDSTYWDEDDILEKRMFDGIFLDGKLNFGDITNNALTGVWKEYGGLNRSIYYWETYHFFGDPSINFRLN